MPEPTEPTKEPKGPAISRRSLLAGAAFVGAGGAWAVYDHQRRHDGDGVPPNWTMKQRTLGRTGLKVSEIGFGSFPTDDPDAVAYAHERGITYFDTSHCYRGGKSERTIGAALEKGGFRDDIVLATKWCPHHVDKPWKKQSFLDILDGSLQRLKTDHVDLVLNHAVIKASDGLGVERLKDDEMFAAFEEAKRAGKVRFLGVSSHGEDLMEVMGYAVESKRFDVLLCRYNFLDYPQQNELIEQAHEAGVGFVAMKTLAGAKGQDLDRFQTDRTSFKQAALRWVLSNEKVSNLIISITDRKQVDEYVLGSNFPMSETDHALLRDYQREFSNQVCRYCGACEQACPHEVRIADVLRFAMYHDDYEQPNRAREAYANLIEAERAAHCLHCTGVCEQACDYELPIKTLLLDAHHKLDGRPYEPEEGSAAGSG